MAKNKIKIDVEIDDKGNLQKLKNKAEGAASSTDRLAKGSRTAERNIKGVGQQSSNATKNFSKMSQGMGGIVGIYANLAAQVFAVSAAFQYLQSAFDYTNLIKGQESLGAITGTTYKTISNALVEATEGQLKYADAAKAAAIGSAAGLSSGQLTKLSEAAKNTSLALGRDLTDSFNRLIRGVTKAEPELLDELGIILRLDTATRNYAAVLGKPVTALNEFERSQAVTNEVLTQAEEKFSKIAKLMDPDAFALNQFIRSFDDLSNTIKEFLAGALAPVFSFLSKNTMALAASLTLFALPILKTILPNLEEWGKASKKRLKEEEKILEKQKTNLKGLTSVTKAEYDKQNATKKASSLLQGKLFKEGTAGSKLQAGENISAREASGLRTSLMKKTGGFVDISDKETIKIKTQLDKIVTSSKVGTEKIKLQWYKTGNVIKVVGTQASVAWKTAMTGMTRATVIATKVMDKAFKAMGIIGIALILADLGMAAYNAVKNFFFPMSEAAIQLEKDTEKVISSYKDLNEELARSRATREDEGLLTLAEYSQNLGQALSGVDILEFTDNFNRFDRSNKEAMTTMSGVVNELVLMDKAFQPLADALRDGSKLSAEHRRELVLLANARVQAGVATTKLTELQQEYNLEVGKLAKGSQATPLDILIENRSKAATESAIKLKEASDRFDEKAANMSYKGDWKLQFEKDKEELEGISDTNNKINAQVKALLKFRKDIVAEQDKQQKNELEIAKLGNLGITFEERKAVFASNTLKRESDLSKVKEEQAAAQAGLFAAFEETNDMSSTEFQNALRILAITENQRLTQVEINRLGEETDDRAEYLIESEERMLVLKKEQFKITKRSNRLSLEQQKNILGISGSFGFQQAGAQRNLDTEKLLQDRIAAQEAVRQAEEKLSRSTYSGEGQGQADTEALEAAKQRVSLLNLEIAARNSIATIKLNELKAENEITAAKIEAISFNPVQQAFNERMIELRKEGVDLGLVDQENLLSEVTTQKELMLLLENKQQLFTYITDGISSGLTSIIDGTKSVKQAFADMAVNVLRDIAQMIVKMMVFRALTTFFAATPTLPTNFGSLDAVSGNGMQFAGMARMGGVFSQGQKVSGYATGGIAKGANAGYPAMLHGTEAVVPLPDGKSIPVSMQGAGQQNNVTVNVSVDSQGNASTNMQQDSAQAGNLGQVIARAVQQELQNQKRSGGILSPYGAT
jgi:hypothetical protein